MRFNFTNPWLLFLMIPGILLALYTFFRVNKRFRYDRNRVVSLILFLISNFLIVLMISGFSLGVDIKNTNNEVILLVDKSESSNVDKVLKDEFVKKTIEEAPDDVSLGVVTFGYDFVYALPLSKNLDKAYEAYLKAELPNPNGTNLDEALDFAASKIKNKETSKIVIVSDFVETDGDALNRIKSLTLSGIMINSLRLEAKGIKNEVLISDFIKPNKGIRPNKDYEYEVLLKSSVRSDISLRVYDNDKLINTIHTSLVEGENRIKLNLMLENEGLHKIKLELDASNDLNKNNNIYISYLSIESIDGILIIERANESEALINILAKQNGGISQDITVKNVKDLEPTSDYLKGFNQIILNNISNADMPKGLDIALHEYAYDYGGSVLTVGGSKEVNGEKVNNTYNKEDMEGSLYQEMLPVVAEEYTPPVGVMVVIDVSGSMTNDMPGGGQRIDAAKEAAKEALNALDPRDYFGVIAFHERPELILKPTPVAKKTAIESKINTINSGMKGTVYSSALDMAGIELRSLERVNKKHIILISDGVPSADDTKYLAKTEENLLAGVTTSCISFMSNVEVMNQVASKGNGRYLVANNKNELKEKLKEELRAEEIREFEYQEFKPMPGENSSIYDGVDTANLPKLDGFYGVRLKKDATSLMVGEYGQPIYASWGYGSGTVASLMVDLVGDFSSNLINSTDGKRIINNISAQLFPSTSIKNNDIELRLKKENIITRANVYTTLNKNEELTIYLSKLIDLNNNEKELIKEIRVENFSGNDEFKLEAFSEGLYEVRVVKKNGDSLISEAIEYFTFSYSMEIDPFIDEEKVDKLNNNINSLTNKENLKDHSEVFMDLQMYYHKDIEFRYWFSSIVLVSLLIDVALMKFKIKWPHEMIKDKRRKEGENEKH